MISVKPQGVTNRFHPPKNWNPDEHGKCNDLLVRIGEYNGLVECVSAWRPDAEELTKLLHGGIVELSVIGNQPPVKLTVIDRPSAVEVGSYDEHGPAQP